MLALLLTACIPNHVPSVPSVESTLPSKTKVPADKVAVPVFLTWNTTLLALLTSATTVLPTAVVFHEIATNDAGFVDTFNLPSSSSFGTV